MLPNIPSSGANMLTHSGWVDLGAFVLFPQSCKFGADSIRFEACGIQLCALPFSQLGVAKCAFVGTCALCVFSLPIFLSFFLYVCVFTCECIQMCVCVSECMNGRK